MNPSDGKIRFTCPKCNQRFRVSPEREGRQFACPRCSLILAVPLLTSRGNKSTRQLKQDSQPVIKLLKENEAIKEIFEALAKLNVELERDVYEILRASHLSVAQRRERLRQAKINHETKVLGIARKYRRKWLAQIYEAGSDPENPSSSDPKKVKSLRRRIQELDLFVDTILSD